MFIMLIYYYHIIVMLKCVVKFFSRLSAVDVDSLKSLPINSHEGQQLGKEQAPAKVTHVNWNTGKPSSDKLFVRIYINLS